MKYTAKRTNEVKRSKGVYLAWVAIFIFLVTTVFLTLTTATSGAEVAKLEDEEAILIRANSELSDQIVNASSLSGTFKKAESLGFSKPEKIIYFSSQDTVAAK